MTVLKIPQWVPKEDLEQNKSFEKLKPSYEYFLFCEFLKHQNSPKAKKLLDEMEAIDDNDTWNYRKLDLKFKTFLEVL